MCTVSRPLESVVRTGSFARGGRLTVGLCKSPRPCNRRRHGFSAARRLRYTPPREVTPVFASGVPSGRSSCTAARPRRSSSTVLSGYSSPRTPLPSPLLSARAGHRAAVETRRLTAAARRSETMPFGSTAPESRVAVRVKRVGLALAVLIGDLGPDRRGELEQVQPQCLSVSTLTLTTVSRARAAPCAAVTVFVPSRRPLSSRMVPRAGSSNRNTAQRRVQAALAVVRLTALLRLVLDRPAPDRLRCSRGPCHTGCSSRSPGC